MPDTLFRSKHFWALLSHTTTIRDFQASEHPTRIHLETKMDFGRGINLLGCGTHFGFVQSGAVKLSRWSNQYRNQFPIGAGMYFCLPEEGTLVASAAYTSFLVVTHRTFEGLFHVGGPIEATGRLKYIDGGTDTVLIPPIRFGDPCLNHLHLPPGVNQTLHTQPSLRVGLITKGAGMCEVPTDDGGWAQIPLEPGTLFIIPPNGQHRFLTGQAPLDFIAYHPDSEFGHRDDDHPMINRTMIGGVSAADLSDLQTK